MRKNLPIIIALMLPLLVVLGVLIVVYMSTESIQPQHDIVVSTEENLPRIPGTDQEDNRRFFIFYIDEERIEEMTAEEVAELSFAQEGEISPEGYVARYGYDYRNSGIFELFGGYNDREQGFILQDGNATRFVEATFPTSQRYYYGNVTILGWIN